MTSVRHIVMFRFRPEIDARRAAGIVADLAALKDKIPGIAHLEWGTNNSPEGKNKGLTHCFVLDFTDAAARDAYLPHPDHVAFVKSIGDAIEDACVFDYSPGH